MKGSAFVDKKGPGASLVNGKTTANVKLLSNGDLVVEVFRGNKRFYRVLTALVDYDD